MESELLGLHHARGERSHQVDLKDLTLRIVVIPIRLDVCRVLENTLTLNKIIIVAWIASRWSLDFSILLLDTCLHSSHVFNLVSLIW